MSSTGLAQVVDRALQDLKRMKDKTRVRMHLAGREARDKWRVLEKKLTRTAGKARTFADSTARALDDLTDEVRKFRTSLPRRQKKRSDAPRNNGPGRSAT
jgi:hypothetical protein